MVEEHTWLRQTAWDLKDEYYTPAILVEPIIPYLKSKSTIWCPFDTEDSEFVFCLEKAGHKVLHSHLWAGYDFFNYEPDEDYDYIISNPPFTQKLEVFNRLYDLNKPFAMVMGLPILNYQVVGSFFLEKQQQGKHLELLIVDKKISFDGNTASFNNSFFCYGILPEGIIFHHLPHNNSNDNFVESRHSKGPIAQSWV